MIDDLERIAPPGAVVVLVDAWPDVRLSGDRRVLPFLERDGVYWGRPADDATAIRELERMRGAGACLIAFHCSSFWWLAHYNEFCAYLCTHFPHRVTQDGEMATLVCFDLRGTEPDLGPSALDWKRGPLSLIERPQAAARDSFPGSAAYWEERYETGGTSGAGSYGRLAEFKAEVLNAFVAVRGVQSVIEFGCGDGNQLALARYPGYLGFDVSPTAVGKCRERFRNDSAKSFRLAGDYRGELADLTLSLDVVYHLVEDAVFEEYMERLFGASRRYVIVYASDSEDSLDAGITHVRHRKFTAWVENNMPGWKLIDHIPNKYPYQGDYTTGSFSEFFVYEKK